MAHDHSHGHSSNCGGVNHDSSHASDHRSLHTSHESAETIQRRQVLRRLYTATILCTCFIIVEVVGGLWAHSLAILSDAAHLFADLASFAVAIAASYLASMPATRQHTFGLKRSESLAALFSMVSLAFVSIGLGYEAVNRLVYPPEELVQGKIMSGVASIGVLVNIALAAVLGENHVHLPGMDHSHGHDHGQCNAHGPTVPSSFSQKDSNGYEIVSYQKHAEDACDDHANMEEGHSHTHDHQATKSAPASAPTKNVTSHGHSHASNQHDHACEALHDDEVPVEDEDDHHQHDQRNINLRAAYMHVMADLAQSVAVLIAGLVIWVRPDYHVIDPILTLLFACLVLYSTLGVLRLSIAVLLEATPPNLSWRKVYEAICKVPNVHDVHDLHIWSISHGQPTLSVHCRSSDPMALRKVRDACLKFGISHATIQVQHVEGPCLTCGDSVSCTQHLSEYDDHRD